MIIWFPCLICLLVGVVIGILVAGIGKIAKGEEEDYRGQPPPERTPPAESEEEIQQRIDDNFFDEEFD